MSSPAPPESTEPAAFAAHDERARAVELLISNLLRIGVISSLVIVIFGTFVNFVRHPEYLSDPRELQHLMTPGAAFPHTLGEVLDGLAHLRGQSIVMAGLLLLIATPVLRVAVSIIGFFYEHDRRYVIITSIVLALLLLSFVLGRAGG